MDIHMNIPAWPGLIAAIGILITRVSAVEVTSTTDASAKTLSSAQLGHA